MNQAQERPWRGLRCREASTGSVNEKRQPTASVAIVEVLRPDPAAVATRRSSGTGTGRCPGRRPWSRRRPRTGGAITSSFRPGPMSVTLNSITPPSSGVWRGTTRSSMLRRAGGRLRAVDRLGRVLQQVEHHLLDQDRVDHQRRQALRDVGVDRHVAPAQLDAGQLDRVVDDRAAPAPPGAAARCASRRRGCGG